MILFDDDLTVQLAEQLQNVDRSVCILSAFLKVDLLIWLKKHINSNIKVTIVSRWRLGDLVCGASDIEVYEYSRSNGWAFFINTNMHHKMYLLDKSVLFIGSANFTKKGFHLGLNGNDESSVLITPSKIDLFKLSTYVGQCCELNDSLFQDMTIAFDDLDERPVDKREGISWPDSIVNQIRQNSTNLWVNDLLFNSPAALQEKDNNFIIHDLSLLKIAVVEKVGDRQKILTNIRDTTVWQWLVRVLTESESEFVRFGEITAKLHNDLIDDPKPHRREVKMFVSNIYEWIKYLDPSEIGIKKFTRTEALYFKVKS